MVSTACAGFVLGSGDHVALPALAWTAAGTWGAAACANALNQVFEAVPDGLMSRTRLRPLPSGTMSRPHALLFAAAVGAGGLGALASHASWASAGLGGATIVLYAFVYTPLKRLSVANTWVGALVGALPPLIGWTAATGGVLGLGALVLPCLLYSWQMPHFMALAYLHKDDYARGGYRMLPLVDPTGARTGGVALRHALLLAPLGFVAASLGVASPPFGWEAAALSLALACGAAAFWAAPGAGSARRLFLLSLLHLPVLQAAAVLHRVPNTDEARAAAPRGMAEWLLVQRLRVENGVAETSPSSGEAVGAMLPAAFAPPFPFLPLPAFMPPRACAETPVRP